MNTFDPERVEAILFDIDGTLADSDDTLVRHLSALLEPLRSVRPAFDPARFSRRLLFALETPLNALYAWWDRLHLDELTAPLGRMLPRRRQRPPTREPLVPGVRSMLERARGHFLLGIVTARSRNHTRRFLQGAELEDMFDVVVTTRSVPRAKPHPAPVLWAADQLGVSPGSCAFVGDTTVDVRAARAAGAQAVAVLCGFGERPELERAGPHLLLESTVDLLDHLPPQSS